MSYISVLHQSVLHLAAWAEDGTPPPASTQYRIEQGQVLLPAAVDERRGLQPVVVLTANGSDRAEVRVGEAVRFAGTIAAPQGAGTIIAADWDLTDGDSFTESSPVEPAQSTFNVVREHRYMQIGTYFVALRGTSQRDGDRETPYARVPYLGLVRVVVREYG